MDEFAAIRRERRKQRKQLKALIKDHKGLGTGDHDNTGTRVRDDTPLRPPPNLYPEPPLTSPKLRAEALAMSDASRDESVNNLRSQESSSVNMGSSADSARSRTTSPSTTERKKVLLQHVRKEKEVLGRGAFGTVYRGLHVLTGEIVAVKEIVFATADRSGTDLKQDVQRIATEIQLLKSLNHHAIVKYYGAERDGNTLYIFMEYVSGGSLASLVSRFGKLEEATLQVFVRQMMQGLEYLHSEGVVHRDIKGDNALLGVAGEVKLADFGASTRISDAMTRCNNTVTGTPWFMAPEVITGAGHGPPADIWSIGCTCIELLTGHPPFANFNNPHAAMFHIASTQDIPPAPEGISSECAEFLSRCFQRDPKQRPTATTLLNTGWLAMDITASHEEAAGGSNQNPAAATKTTTTPPTTTRETMSNTNPVQEPLSYQGSSGVVAPSGGLPKRPPSYTGGSNNRITMTNPMVSVGNSTTGPILQQRPVGTLSDVNPIVSVETSAVHPPQMSVTAESIVQLEYLQKLSDLAKKGVISEAEFLAKKKEILGF